MNLRRAAAALPGLGDVIADWERLSWLARTRPAGSPGILVVARGGEGDRAYWMPEAPRVGEVLCTPFHKGRVDRLEWHAHREQWWYAVAEVES